MCVLLSSGETRNYINIRKERSRLWDRSSRVRELIQKHHQSVSMKVNLPLIELEAAKEDLDRFLQECLQELGSDPQTQKILDGATGSIQPDYACLGCGAAYGGGPSAGDPRRVVQEARHEGSRCG